MKHLDGNAIERAIAVLGRFKKTADSLGARVRAVATSAVREALNQKLFIERVKRETGIDVEVIAGSEEARLIYLGIIQALPVHNKKVLLVDIGGGSTEFLLGLSGEVIYSNSLKLGAIRLTQRFFPTGKITPRQIKACREYTQGQVTVLKHDIENHGYEIAIGTSGTISAVATIINERRKTHKAKSGLNNFLFWKDELLELVERIRKCKNTNDVAKIKGVEKERADILTAGILILEAVFNELKLGSMTVSEYALKEGLVLNALNIRNKNTQQGFPTDIKRSSIIQLMQRYSCDHIHAQQVCRLSLAIFDQTRLLHKLPQQARQFLEAAALLHDIGFFVAHSKHHRHSYYIIRNSDLPGYTEREKEIIATVSRYHRKSHPKPKHEGFKDLNGPDQELVRKLAGILRIADGLDRTHNSLVRSLHCKTRKNKVSFTLEPALGHALSLEIWGAGMKKELFEESFAVKTAFLSHH
jgi:exopolyphosphatase/guanosine-5'-triphosphate,3'-diphosphate pyrophosphatase